MQTDVFYVESESTDNVYYYVKFKPDVIEWCSCMDSSTRGLKCKHQFAIEHAIRMGTLKDTDKLPTEAKRDNNNTSSMVLVSKPEPITATIVSATPPAKVSTKSYKDDDYSF